MYIDVSISSTRDIPRGVEIGFNMVMEKGVSTCSTLDVLIQLV
jgi:hypothetical protein